VAEKKTTKRERRDEAKRRRLEELRRRERQARIRRIVTWSGVGGAIAAVVALIVLLSGGGGNPKESNRLATLAGCDQVESKPILKSDHITPPATATYNSNPPTSGNHYNAAGLGPLTTGIHRAPVQYEGSVHNLEHGHIVIFYKESVGRAVADQLAAVVRSDPDWIMMSPNPNMPFQVAFTAWGKLQGCNAPNDQGIKAAADDFVKRFKNKAPESIKGTPEPGTATAVPPASATPSPTGSASPSPSPTPTATGT
jgi:hypothetical protein